MIIRYRGVWSCSDGYGTLGRNLILALTKLGVVVRLTPDWALIHNHCEDRSEEEMKVLLPLISEKKDYKIVLHHMIPDGFIREPRTFNLLSTIFENKNPLPYWVDIANSADEVWLNNEYVNSIWVNGGLDPKKVNVIPQGINLDVFHPTEPLIKWDDDCFHFLASSTMLYRKGWDVLLNAYLKEFDSDEKIRLHIFTKPTFMCDIGFIKNYFKKYDFMIKKENKPVYDLILENIPTNLMSGFICSFDAFVLPSRSEGWGSHYQEAMACGVPTIGTEWSGQLTFMNHNNSYLIRVEKEEPVRFFENYQKWNNESMRWAKPSEEHLRELMRYVFEHQAEAKKKGKVAVDEMKKWSWEKIAPLYKSRLEKIEVGL